MIGLARSTRDLLNTLASIAAKKAGFRSSSDTWADTMTAHGRFEHALRNLDKFALGQQNRVACVEKELHDYQMQADRPFEHEERLRQLLGRQAELHALLDLDKGDQQGGRSSSG